jgi:hypothetical protein
LLTTDRRSDQTEWDMASTDKHGWLRDALRDKSIRAKDLAEAWGVDDAVVSRFIKTGDPELTLVRALELCRLLGFDMPQLLGKMGLHTPATKDVVKQEGSEGVQAELANLREATDRAGRVLPKGYQISVRIFYTGTGGT